MHEIFDAPEWFEALTLAERAALLGPALDPAPPPERLDLARRKAARWRQESNLLDDDLLAERLALDGLTPDRFLRLLAEPAAGLRRRSDGPPPWLRLLVRSFSQTCPPLPATLEDEGALGILELLRPLIADTCARALDGLRRIERERPGTLEPEALAGALLPALLERLRGASERTLALELHASRLEGTLQGETPEERFRDFVARLRRPAEALEILQRYPVLARDACRHAEQWVAASLEMMERFVADRDEIARLLGSGGDPGPVIAARSGLSDRHAGGRAVAVLTFASGARTVYKPKPLAIDRAFQTLVSWLDERGAEPPLRSLRILDRGDYGWMEHVASSSCATAGEVERFHARQGGWLALLYVLEATDFHHENLIADGEEPVPVDFETLFQPAFAEPAASGPGYAPTAYTVLHSGLLPRRFWAPVAGGGIDLSGMGAAAGQRYEVKGITGEGTDEMRWARQEQQTAAGPHLPTLDGAPLALWEHAGAVQHGFRAMYRLLGRHREELAARLEPFAGLAIRTLLRGTSAYAHLLHVAGHPDYLRSALDRDRLFDRLWLEAVGYRPLRRAVRAEQEDLAGGDIPRFQALAASTDLLATSGRRIEGYFATPGLELVRARLRAMDEDDLERQCWLVHAAIEATRPLDARWRWTAAALPAAGPAAGDRFLGAARRLGDRLAQLAVEQGGIVTWFHLDLRNDGWLLEPMRADLYSGLSGLALFLAHLGRLAEDERYERLARLALATVRGRLAAEPETLIEAGAFSGWGGIVYALTHLGLLWREPGLLDEAERLASRCGAAAGTDESFDLVAGSAGAIAALLALHCHRPSPAVLEAAVRCGERLLARAAVDARGHAWPVTAMGPLPLTGFSHGTAGIAWALARLAHASGDERFRAAARGALRYERSWFCRERDNWPDLRESRGGTEEGTWLHAWCHGAPGIGLGRTAILPYLDDPEMRDEIRAAVRSTRVEGFGFNHSLCHGDLGNLELIREAGRVLEDAELAAEADRLAGRILTQIEAGGPRCGANASTELLGLMTGLAGIGYGLLRAAWPERVPSVLLLEVPGD
ncbi:MAG TPA: type 2 lanthipeptide synthetase LanM family protein [Thermoanaerobaculia bacterium]|nr:type 2 lanthipeptide synthetase LanM family protein [Thermoanaerobaculia bacterium]